MSTGTPRDEARLLPYHIIEAASRGDVDALSAVLKHFEGYIITLSMRRLFDEHGHPVVCMDEDLRRRLETKLITKVLAFNTE